LEGSKIKNLVNEKKRNQLLVTVTKTASLPATVVAELELNSVKPPPDKIKEDK
jgi:hypothetical protein